MIQFEWLYGAAELCAVVACWASSQQRTSEMQASWCTTSTTTRPLGSWRVCARLLADVQRRGDNDKDEHETRDTHLQQQQQQTNNTTDTGSETQTPRQTKR